MRRGRGLLTVLVALALAGGVTGAVVAATRSPDVVGPRQRLLVDGRRLHPQGTLVSVGNFPTGGALTPDGRFYWTVSTGRGLQDIRIVSVATAKVVQVVPIPGASGGIVMDPRGGRAFVSGVPDSDHADQQRPGLPGRRGDVVQVLRYDRRSGRARFAGLLPVPAPSIAQAPQSAPPAVALPTQDFPPGARTSAWPDRLAISPDGATLLVPLNLTQQAAIVDVRSGRVRYVTTGDYPYGAAILRDGRTGLVSNEAPGTVSVIDLRSARKVKDVQVGANLSHPEAIAVDPKADRAFVTVTNSDQVAVLDTRRLTVTRMLSVGRAQGLGAAPNALTVTPDGRRLLVTEPGADELAVFDLPGSGPAARSAAARRADRAVDRLARASAASVRGGAGGGGGEAEERAGARPAQDGFRLAGRIPVAAYPADVQVTAPGQVPCAGAAQRRAPRRRRPPVAFTGSVRPAAAAAAAAPGARRCSKLVWLAAKGLGVGPNPRGPVPLSPKDTDDTINAFRYLPSIVSGAAGVLELPDDRRVARLTPLASATLRPTNAQAPPPGTPLRPGGPIKHVFYVVRENRTYDQVLGDDPRGDGDPKLTLFGRPVTPNLHALVRRFPLVDHLYANSEASIDGHFWTSAAQVSDYVHKNWFENYGGRGRPYDFGVYSITWPANGFLFDQADRQGISYFNYGEAIAGDVPFPDRDRDAQASAGLARRFAHSDLGAAPPAPGQCYPNDASIGKDAISGRTVFDSTPPAGADPTAESRLDCFRRHFTAQVATGTVPSFNYLVLSNDHTRGLSPGAFSPRAMVADNDLATGQLVDLISHSPVWRDSAVFVIEDDSQDGADHVDAHRTVGAVFSPYARRGAVVHTRYDFLSVIRSMELVLGMRPLGLFDRQATPMYDAFTPTPDNAEPFNAVAPSHPLLERNPSTPATRAASRGMDFSELDRVPQRALDAALWRSVHGMAAQPPPPGPDARPGG